MIRIATLVIVCMVLYSCAVNTQLQSDDKNPAELFFAQPLSDNLQSTDWFEIETSEGVKKVFWETLSAEKINQYLGLESSFVSIVQKTNEGKLQSPTSTYTGAAGEYELNIDYFKYRKSGDSKCPADCFVGVGVRVAAKITTTKDNLDVSTPFAIGVAAKLGYLSGKIAVQKIGIDSPKFGPLIPPPSEINEASLLKVMEAIAVIRSKLYDSDTKLSPHILKSSNQNLFLTNIAKYRELEARLKKELFGKETVYLERNAELKFLKLGKDHLIVELTQETIVKNITDHAIDAILRGSMSPDEKLISVDIAQDGQNSSHYDEDALDEKSKKDHIGKTVVLIPYRIDPQKSVTTRTTYRATKPLDGDLGLIINKVLLGTYKVKVVTEPAIATCLKFSNESYSFEEEIPINSSQDAKIMEIGPLLPGQGLAVQWKFLPHCRH